jgi:hypothetical protein
MLQRRQELSRTEGSKMSATYPGPTQDRLNLARPEAQKYIFTAWFAQPQEAEVDLEATVEVFARSSAQAEQLGQQTVLSSPDHWWGKPWSWSVQAANWYESAA